MSEPKDYIKNLKPSKVENIENPLRLKLDKNENIYGASKFSISVLRNFDFERVSLYPDTEKYVHKFSKIYNINPEKILFTPGVDNGLNLIFSAYLEKGDEFLCFELNDDKSELYAHLAGAEVKYIDYGEEFEFNIDKIREKITDKTKICYFSTPNSITGKCLRAISIIKLLKEFPKTLFIVDISYAGFVQNVSFNDYSDMVYDFKNIIITKSYSNDYALAGFGLEILVSNEEIIENLKKIQPSYSVDELNFICTISAINDDNYFEEIKKENIEARNMLHNGLLELGFKPYESEANFILCNFGSYCEFFYNKLKNNGVIVKKFNTDTSASNCLRITIPKISGVKFLLKLLKTKNIIAFALEDTLIGNDELLINTDTLEQLSLNHDMILISNKTKDEIFCLLKKFDIEKYFSLVLSDSSKIAEILAKCPSKPTLVVSDKDILTSANRAEIKSIVFITKNNNNNETINNFKHFGCDEIIYEENSLLEYFATV